VNATAGTEKTITSKNSDQNTMHLFQERKNVLNNPLVNPEKVSLPPLHIELGLTKNFVEAMDKNGRFMYLKHKFLMLSDAKIKEGIFVGPQIRELIKDEQFEQQLNEVGNAAWQALKNVTKSFLGNHKAENYHEILSDVMSLKVYFLDSHLRLLP
jgi:hypothetical protein